MFKFFSRVLGKRKRDIGEISFSPIVNDEEILLCLRHGINSHSKMCTSFFLSKSSVTFVFFPNKENNPKLNAVENKSNCVFVRKKKKNQKSRQRFYAKPLCYK